MVRRNAFAITLALCLALIAGCAQEPSRTQAEPRADGLPAASPRADERAQVEEYRLGPGDTVKISVYNSPDLTTEAAISQAGTISFPLIGNVKLGGLSPTEGEKVIAQRLQKGAFIKQPHVNLQVLQYRSQQVSVLGEVNKPGMYPLERASTVTDLLAAAGGISPKGSNIVTLIRKDTNGATHRYRVNVKSVFGDGDVSSNVNVARGDIIHVPPMSVFYIYGEVRQPGSYPLAPDMTVRQALSVGGGLTPRGTERGIKVDRKDPDGTIKTYRARLTDKLEPDDVVQVSESWF